MESEQISQQAPIKTVIRIRPFIGKQLDDHKTVISTQEKKIILNRDASPDSKTYQFDFDQLINDTNQNLKKQFKITQEDNSNHSLWKSFGNQMFLSCLEGFNCTLFIYGITSSGKSYNFNEIKNQLIEKLYQRKNALKQSQKMKIRISVVQIYNEKITQCLSGDKFQQLKLRQHPQKGVYIEDVIERQAQTIQQAKNIIMAGEKMIMIMTTYMSAQSSKKCLVLTLNIEQITTQQDNSIKIISSTINLVKMAGCQKVQKTGMVALQEAVKIGKSLSTFGTVICAVVKKQQESTDSISKIHIPYRDSVLTRLFQNSIGGSCRTYFLFTITPQQRNFEETLSNLRFLQIIRKVKNNPKKNVKNYQLMSQQIGKN